MNTALIKNPSASKGEFAKPAPKPNLSFGGELHPSLIAMVWAQPFSGLDSENPCNHLHEFEEVCSCLSISGMTRQNTKVEVVSLLSHGEGEVMVHICCRKYEQGLG